MEDSNLFHNLETWAPDPSHQTTTVYLNQMQTFQRHLTTEAFKIAGGLDLNPSSSKPVRQHRIAANFTTKIIKSFLDSLYAFLDGLVHLASEELEYERPFMGTTDPRNGSNGNQSDAMDLSNTVCITGLFHFTTYTYFVLQETRLLIVVSNFGHLKSSLIPSMIGQLERALGTNVDNDRMVCYIVFSTHAPMLNIRYQSDSCSGCSGTRSQSIR